MNPGSLIFDPSRFMASLFHFIDVTAVTALFLSRKTAVYGYLLNGYQFNFIDIQGRFSYTSCTKNQVIIKYKIMILVNGMEWLG